MQGSGEHYGQRNVAVLGLGNHIINPVGSRPAVLGAVPKLLWLGA